MNILVKSIGCILLWAAALFLRAGPVHAQLVFSDDFSGSMDKWQVAQGNASTWWVNNGIISGRLTSRFRQEVIVPRDELWDESWNSYELSYRMLPVSGADKNIVFGYEDPGNWYELHFYPHGSEVVRVAAGQVVWQQQHPLRIDNGSWQQVRITAEPEMVRISVNEEQLYNITDPEFSDRFARPGLKVTTGAVAPTEVYFDDFEVKLTGESFSLPVERFTQNDQQWGPIEYDSASTWAEDSSITAWGCALTSAVMILQFHGFGNLPNGTFLTPASLNNWLLGESDGYIGNGLVNWLAITRLTHQLGQQGGSYSLEYRHHPPDMTMIPAHLQANNPVVLQIPGHFMVGSGLTAGGDIIIKDPAYTYNLFSEHQQELLSFRTFTPSYTDLSYLLLNYSPEISIELPNAAGELETITGESYLQSAENHLTLSPALLQTEISKPPPGIYSALVSQAEYGPATIEAFAYSPTGEPYLEAVNVSAGPYQTQLMIELTANYELNFHVFYDFAKMKVDIENMKAAEDLKTWEAFLIINQYLDYALTAARPGDQLRYIELMNRLLVYYQHDFEPNAYLHLIENLDAFAARLQESAV